jgi:hypothetical protein
LINTVSTAAASRNLRRGLDSLNCLSSGIAPMAAVILQDRQSSVLMISAKFSEKQEAYCRRDMKVGR